MSRRRRRGWRRRLCFAGGTAHSALPALAKVARPKGLWDALLPKGDLPRALQGQRELASPHLCVAPPNLKGFKSWKPVTVVFPACSTILTAAAAVEHNALNYPDLRLAQFDGSRPSPGPSRAAPFPCALPMPCGPDSRFRFWTAGAAGRREEKQGSTKSKIGPRSTYRGKCEADCTRNTQEPDRAICV